MSSKTNVRSIISAYFGRVNYPPSGVSRFQKGYLKRRTLNFHQQNWIKAFQLKNKERHLENVFQNFISNRRHRRSDVGFAPDLRRNHLDERNPPVHHDGNGHHCQLARALSSSWYNNLLYIYYFKKIVELLVSKAWSKTYFMSFGLLNSVRYICFQ